MPTCNIGDPQLNELLDRYGDRIAAHVAETGGGRFDVALTIRGLEIACLRLRGSSHGVLLYSDSAGRPAAVDEGGTLVPLP